MSVVSQPSSPPPGAERLGEVGDSRSAGRRVPTSPSQRTALAPLPLPPMGGEGFC